MKNYFVFEGENYFTGTVVQIYAEHKDKFKFYSNIIFEEYDEENDLCTFKSLYSSWDRFYIPYNKLGEYIEKIVEPYYLIPDVNGHKIKEDCVEGIISAWIWYILIMIFGLFLKGTITMVGIWIIASVVFFTWRYNKMNGE